MGKPKGQMVDALWTTELGCSLHKWSESPLKGDTPFISEPGVYESGVHKNKETTKRAAQQG